METLARSGLLISCMLAIYVGGRTLLIWRHTRMIQEFCIGLNVLSIAIGGLVLTLIGALSGTTGAAPLVPYVLGLLGLAAHVAALWIGTWKIFRPAERWPLPFVALGVALAIAWMTLALMHNGEAATQARSMLLLVARGGGMLWAAYECFRYSAMLRKRVALGLAEPMMAHRIWLWGVGAGASIAVIGLEIACWMSAGVPLAASAWGLHATSFFGLIGTVSIALAFFPPESYVRIVESNPAPVPGG